MRNSEDNYHKIVKIVIRVKINSVPKTKSENNLQEVFDSAGQKVCRFQVM